jgi:hypothetical protein
VRNVEKGINSWPCPIEFPLVLTVALLHRNLFKDDWLSFSAAATEKRYFCIVVSLDHSPPPEILPRTVIPGFILTLLVSTSAASFMHTGTNHI